MSAAPFPSLIIRGDALIPRGSFAESQAIFLNPDPAEIVATAAATGSNGFTPGSAAAALGASTGKPAAERMDFLVKPMSRPST